MMSRGPSDAVRQRLGLSLPAERPPLLSRLRTALEIILGVLVLLCAYGWHQERDIADGEKSRAEVAERRLANCMGCAQSWVAYRDQTNHRRK